MMPILGKPKCKKPGTKNVLDRITEELHNFWFIWIVEVQQSLDTVWWRCLSSRVSALMQKRALCSAMFGVAIEKVISKILRIINHLTI